MKPAADLLSFSGDPRGRAFTRSVARVLMSFQTL